MGFDRQGFEPRVGVAPWTRGLPIARRAGRRIGAERAHGRGIANVTARLGHRFEDALAYAARQFRDEVRKVSGVPYVSHLLAVSALVIEDGGEEDEAIAALLHDLVEDRGGAAKLAEVRERFGERVASIVEACSDSLVDTTVGETKLPWRDRKQAYLARLRTIDDPGTLRVSCADKLHNARAILADHRALGDAVYDRFNAGSGRAEKARNTLWYYRSVAEVYPDTPLAAELRHVVAELEARSRRE